MTFKVFFFSKYWDQIGPNVCEMIREFFNSGKINRELNKTFIVLIPKVASPSTTKELRPISLCNFAFKLITKILADRLKVHLDKLISKSQHAFVPNRSIFDAMCLLMKFFILLRTSQV